MTIAMVSGSIQALDLSLEMNGAVHRCRLALARLGIRLDDEQVRAVAMETLCGFVRAGGLEPQAGELLRRATAELVED